MSRQILVTSALPYANGAIHLGHLVEYIQTDIWVRFQKMSGNECWYVCADDTHGTPIMLRAEKEGITPEALIARVHGEHSRDFAGFHVGFDNYYSTHSEETRHYANEIYSRLKAADLIETRTIEQYYDPAKQMFLRIYENTDDPTVKKTSLGRLQSYQSEDEIAFLNRLLASYREQKGGCPPSLPAILSTSSRKTMALRSTRSSATRVTMSMSTSFCSSS